MDFIHKTNEYSKVDATEQQWLAHVRDYHIFNDAQARLILDALRDVHGYARNDCKKEVDGLQDALLDFVCDNVMGRMGTLRDELRTHRERVAMLEGQLKAMTELKASKVSAARAANLGGKACGVRKATPASPVRQPRTGAGSRSKAST